MALPWLRDVFWHERKTNHGSGGYNVFGSHEDRSVELRFDKIRAAHDKNYYKIKLRRGALDMGQFVLGFGLIAVFCF